MNPSSSILLSRYSAAVVALVSLAAVAAAVRLPAQEEPSSAGQPAVLIRNGDMTLATAAGTPSGWTLGSHRAGNVTLARDTGDFVSAPASLLLSLEAVAPAAEAEGFAQQPLLALPATGALHVRGMIRAEGNFSFGQIVLQAFDADWKQLDWKIIDFVKPADDWQGFGGVAKIPAGAVHVVFGVVAKGTGKIRLDDIRIVETAAP
ncbi:hypothetical protein OPIT5_09890 [Opitutaceae bacterium TAV5]|nr:hypothetical protein OPIT5_09890 [Opitutaceae bacterium TAV5]